MNLDKDSKFEVEIRGFLPIQANRIAFFEQLNRIFGKADITDELVIFFKYNQDVRLRLNKRGTEMIIKTKPLAREKSIKEEFKINIPLAETDNYIRFLNLIGYQKGLFSYCTRYYYKNPIGNFSVKLDSVLGDFWEFDKNISSIKDYNNTKNLLKQFSKNTLHLKSWTDKEYDEYRKLKWKDIQPEPLILNNNLHSTIQSILEKYMNHLFISQNYHESLKEILQFTSNDYSDLEENFRKQTNFNLLTTRSMQYDNDFNLTASIIIPVFNSYETLEFTQRSILLQNLTESQFSKLEVIIVDDGSEIQGLDSLYKYYKDLFQDKKINLRLIRSYSNMGRASARNIGLEAATGEVIFFIDSDVILYKNYLKEHMIRHQYLDKVVLVGFKENININNTKLLNLNKISKPDIKKDFRFSKKVDKNWIGLYPIKKRKTVECLTNSNYFKKFGLGKTIGPFDLPCMVVSHNFSVPRHELESVGGFSKEFGYTWGFEDTFLGAKLIAHGNYIIPVLSTGVYHIETISENETGIKKEKQKEMQKNFVIYKKLIEYPFISRNINYDDEN